MAIVRNSDYRQRMPKVSPPYPGQGLPLPVTMKLNGAWIIENIAAIVLDEPSVPDDNGVFQRAPKSPLGNNVYTVDARTLARNFEMSVERLFEENRAGRLLLSFSVSPDEKVATLKFFCNNIESSVDFERFTEH